MSDTQVVADALRVTYDGSRHCTVSREPNGRRLAMDACGCGGGERQELSPVELVGPGLGGCMLLSMGVLARRENLDLTGTRVDVDVSMGDRRIDTIALSFRMPRNFSTSERLELEKAAGFCPIKPSLHPDIPIAMRFTYPE